MKKSYSIAIIGATGIVGATTLSILEERNFPIDRLYLVASHRSAGGERLYQGKAIKIEDIEQFDFSKVQLCFFCAGNDISESYCLKAAAEGCIVIDKSSHFRYHNEVPLVVPEVNANLLSWTKKNNIIANPNCNTIPLVVALKPIHDAVGIRRMNVATYQSVSGGGKEAVVELTEQTSAILEGRDSPPKVFSQQIAFNILPFIDALQDNGYTKEEMKIVWETQKILNDKTIAINATAVRVPVYVGHSAAVHIETNELITVEKALALLAQAPGVRVIENPTPVQDAAGKDAVFVGRVRKDLSHSHGLNLWVVTDNIRKGAALNAVQIAEKLISQSSE